MDTFPSSNPNHQPPYFSYHYALHTVRDFLPPPLEDTPEGWLLRDQTVLEEIADLVPASGTEAVEAAYFVAGTHVALHYMQLAHKAQYPEERDRLLMQASRTGRDARGYLNSLHRIQTMRMKREATRAGAEIADRIQENARLTLHDALADPPKPKPAVPPPAADAALAEPQAPAGGIALPPPSPAADGSTPAPERAAPAAPDAAKDAAPPPPPKMPVRLVPPPRHFVDKPPPKQPRRQDDDDMPKTNWAEEAERYAIIYPDRARIIRELGRVPEPCTFGPPEQRLVQAIVTGRSPALLRLDEPQQEQRARG